jgi:hypothetical protein
MSLGLMSALGHRPTYAPQKAMSACPHSDCESGHVQCNASMSALGQKQTIATRARPGFRGAQPDVLSFTLISSNSERGQEQAGTIPL